MKNTSLLKGSAAFALCISLFNLSVNAQESADHLPPLTEEMLGTEKSWLEAGEAAIKQRLAQIPNTKRAKNVILFVGDGMGVSTLTAARILEGQLNGKPGEENYLSFEKFPNTALVKTYNVDAQVADSAGTASALNTGVKTRIGVINTGPGNVQRDCATVQHNKLTPLAEYAEKAGMSTGLVSTARITHATPAAVYAVSPSRNWENDTEVPTDASNCPDIASQITNALGGNGLEVALGGGRRNFQPKGTGNGRRMDNRDLTKEWQASRKDAAYVSNVSELSALDLSSTSRLLGLFDDSHMDYEFDRAQKEASGTAQPHIADMTETAIKILSQNENGYYLMVEGGRVDHAHHAGNAHRALHDAVALSKAVERAVSMVDTSETLILVTADHSHVFTIAGYPRRGNPIFGLVTPTPLQGDDPILANDDKPYTTLGYHNGSGAIKGERPALTHKEVVAPDYQQQALIPTNSETHGGEDVALFGIGPWSHLVAGTMEQNVVFHIMKHALDFENRPKR